VSVTADVPRVNVLGVGVSALTLQQTLRLIDAWIAEGTRHYICVTGVHGVMESQRDESLRRIHNAADLVTPDGMPLVWLSRLAGHKQVERVYGPDLLLACCEASESTGHRHYFYGGAPGVPERLVQSLARRFPKLNIAGAESPPFHQLSPDEDAAAVARINDARPDIVWVGLGCPRQERWMNAHVGRLSAAVSIGVGAAFDFVAGVKRQAPRWMQRSGLEWAFRLASEPRRLGLRYLLNNPLFIWKAGLQAMGWRRYPEPV
jgi:N-acetylglucosaminyldiphosphoundecaprenol N-acetyl-beta-D-mannosaminyltransferase